MDRIVSVIMSVFNETESELRMAIDSVLKQTFSEFEFIIVCDNPNNELIATILKEYENADQRVKIVWNTENMGLALSLNEGIRVSKGDYIIRMDADDVCLQDRFEKQIRLMQTEQYDLIWSSYEFIDENGIRLNESVNYYQDEMIKKVLPLENIIHHPTVIMRRDAVSKAGMYRKFPCAQDYDLWLRMFENGCQMHMMKDSLLLYRVRRSSITNKRKYQQLCTLDYIRYITRVRRKKGKDIYSYNGYLDYIKKLGVGNKEIETNFELAREFVSQGKNKIKSNNFFVGILCFVKGMYVSKFYRKQVLLTLRRNWVKRS